MLSLLISTESEAVFWQDRAASVIHRVPPNQGLPSADESGGGSNPKDWTDPPNILEGLTLIVLCFQAWIFARQAAIADRQTDLLVKQEGIARDQFAAAYNPLIFIRFRPSSFLKYDWVNVGGGAAILAEINWDMGIIRLGIWPSPMTPAPYAGPSIPAGIVIPAGKSSGWTEQSDHADIESRWLTNLPEAGTADEGTVFYVGYIRYHSTVGDRFITGFFAVYEATSATFKLTGDERYNYHHKEE